MREIKCRGCNKDSKRWITGSYVDGYIINGVVEANEEYIVIGKWTPVEKESVGQYTGLKDKNGVEIYEGDIVKVMDSSLAVVEYCKKRTAFCLKDFIDETDYWLLCQYETIEVIGNIFEDEDLLKGD